MNIYSKMWAGYGLPTNKAPKSTKAPKLYNLLYRGEIVVKTAPYAVCRAKMNELLRSTNYNKQNFKISKA